MANETNKYADSKGPDPKWHKTTASETIAFLLKLSS